MHPKKTAHKWFISLICVCVGGGVQWVVVVPHTHTHTIRDTKNKTKGSKCKRLNNKLCMSFPLSQP